MKNFVVLSVVAITLAACAIPPGRGGYMPPPVFLQPPVLTPYFIPTNQPVPMRPSPPGNGVMGFLKNQSASGSLKYCYYSNGVINTINSYELCPLNTGQ